MGFSLTLVSLLQVHFFSLFGQARYFIFVGQIFYKDFTRLNWVYSYWEVSPTHPSLRDRDNPVMMQGGVDHLILDLGLTRCSGNWKGKYPCCVRKVADTYAWGRHGKIRLRGRGWDQILLAPDGLSDFSEAVISVKIREGRSHPYYW